MLQQHLHAVEVLRSKSDGQRVRVGQVLQSRSWTEPVAGCKAAVLWIRNNGMPLASP